MLFYVLIYVFVLWVQRLRIIACARSFYSSSAAATAATASASAVHLSFARSLPPVWYWNVNTIQNINTVKFQPSHISTKKSCVYKILEFRISNRTKSNNSLSQMTFFVVFASNFIQDTPILFFQS